MEERTVNVDTNDCIIIDFFSCCDVCVMILF